MSNTNKILKTIQIKWKWHGDLYLLKGFNICLMPSGYNPVDNPDRIIVFNNVLPNAEVINSEYVFSYNFVNQPLDEGSTCVPWVQAIYDNSDSKWASMGGQVIEDDGQATIVVVGNPTFQQIIDMADDSKITPQEKLQLQKEWEEVVAQHQQIEIGAVKADILNSTEVTNYINSVYELAKYLNYNQTYEFPTLNSKDFTYPNMLIDKQTTNLDSEHYGGKSTYDSMWRAYYEARIDVLEKIRDQLFENNKNEIQGWLGENNMPTTIETGGYISSKLTANMNYDNKVTAGTIKVHYGTFITPTGVKFSIEGNKHVPTILTSNINRTVYLIFIGADSSRFAFTSNNDSQQFITATHNGTEWFYLHNGVQKTFKPNTEDCIVAKVEEYTSDDTLKGIKAIKLLSSNSESIFDALTDGGKSQGIYRDEETGLIFINAEFMKIGQIQSQNKKSVFDLNDGTFRLGGTEENDFRDYSLKFDGKDLYLGEGSLKWENFDDEAKENMQSISVKITDGTRAISVSGNNQILTSPTAYIGVVKSGTKDITNECILTWEASGIFTGSGVGTSFIPAKNVYTEKETYIQLTARYNSVNYTEKISLSVSKAGLDGANGVDGVDGKDGIDGIDGTNGKDGVTYYTWIKYADDNRGSGMSSSPTGKLYIGIAYNQKDSTPSDIASDYAWSLIKGEDGLPGVNGLDGKTYYTWIKYADSPKSGMSDSPDGKLYMGIAYNRETKAESTNYDDYSWSLIKGSDGINGTNGVTYYTWIRYADDNKGTNMSSSPEGKLYIGIAYNQEQQEPSNVASKYAWSLIKGTDGIPGTNGKDGITYYTWIKYADDVRGTNMSDDPTGKLYMGIAYNKTSSKESTNYNDYAWSLIKGSDGEDGADGDTFYTWIKYADDKHGTNMSDDPTGKTYIGIAYNQKSENESTVSTDYAWSLIKGTDGLPGLDGVDGKTYYTWIKYADTPTSGMSDYPEGKTYMGIAYNRDSDKESNNYEDYSWSLIKGADGAQGPQGPAGANGANGKTYYTWIRYADTPTSGMSDNPTNKTYIGIAYNKEDKNPSSNYGDYSWSLIKGADGKPGTNGIDGETYYTWIKYADSPTEGMSDSPEGKAYIGLAYNKSTDKESTNYNDYAWSLIKGADGEDGKDGANAQYVIVSGEQAFKYTDNYTGTPTPTSITLKATAIGFNNASYQWSYKTPTSSTATNISNATSSTYTLTHNDSIWSSNKQLTLRCTCGDYYDEITVVKVTDGKNGTNGTNGANGEDAYTVTLTNENHTFASDSDGNISKNLVTTTKVIAYKGTSTVTPIIGAITNPSGMTITKSGTELTITALSGTNLADTGTFDIPITIDGKSFTKTFTWAKSKQGIAGINGTNGTNGTNATAYWLISSASAIGKNTSNVFNPTSVTFTAKYQTGSSAVSNYNGRFIIAETTNGTDFTDKYTSSSNESSKTYSPSTTSVTAIRVRLYQAGGTSVILDEQLIPIVTDGTNGVDGQDAITAVLSNESHNIPCNTSGTPTTYTGATTTMSVFVGSSDTSSSWTYSIATTNITGTASNNNRTYTVTGISADTGYVDITASRNGYSSVTKRFTLSKSKQGATGTAGANATAYWLISSTSAIGKSSSNIFNPTSVTFTAKSQTGTNAVTNYSGRFIISESTDGSTFATKYTSSANESSKTYSPSSTSVKSIKVVLYQAGGTSVALDEQIIPIVIDGKDGQNGTNGSNGIDGESAVTAVLSNESHNIPCNTSGTPTTYAGANTTMSVYVGSTDTSSSWTYSITATNVTGTSSNSNRTYTVTGISADVGYVDIKAERSGYSSVTKRFTITKSKQGATGPQGPAGTNGTNGTNATAYWLISSASAIGKNTSNVFNPTSVTFTLKSQTGTSAVANYSGRLIIAESTDGTNFTDKYTSSANESSKTYSPSSTSVKSIRVRMYQAGGTSVLLDEQLIPIVTDGTNGTNGKDAVTAVLSNESHNIPCNTSGTPTTYAGAITTMSVFVGASDTSSSWTYSVSVSNVTGTSSNSNRTYTVTGISADTGYVDITATRSGYSSVTKRFTLTKSKQGATGATGPQGPTGATGPQGPAGSNGTNGTNGTDGNSVELRYLRSLYQPATPTGTSPSGWSTTTAGATGSGTLWMTQAIKNSKTGAIVTTWSTPVALEIPTSNLLHNHKWTVGTGTVGVYSMNGVASENKREILDTPDGRDIVWRCISDGANDGSGGWNATVSLPDNTKQYRFSVWVKKKGSVGSVYLGATKDGTITSLAGAANTNPYFWSGNVPTLDKWYLMVGFVNGSTDTSTTNNPNGGLYDPATGEMTNSTPWTTFKFTSTAKTVTHRAYYFYATTADAEVQFYAPRIDIIDGSEPSITDILGMSPQLDWVKEWNGTKTEVSGTSVISPKIFAGTVSSGVPTGVAMGLNVFGSGSTYSGLAGYKAGTNTFHLGTDGSFRAGLSSGSHIAFNPSNSQLTIKANSITIGGVNAATTTTVNNAVAGKVDNNQQAIFNTLTNNQANQGIYLSGTNLYVNATYIKSGTIDAARLNVSSIVSSINNQSTTINGDKITTGTITADRLLIGAGENGGLVKYPTFTSWSDSFPNGASSWNAGGISKVTVDNRTVAQFTCSTAGTQYGMRLNPPYFSNGLNLEGVEYITLQVKFRLTSGTSAAGASFLVDIYRTDGTYQRLQLNMKDAGTTLTTNTWYTVTKVFKVSDVTKTFSSVSGYLLANWSSVGDAVKTIQFASANAYLATKQDYLTQSWTSGTEINGTYIKTGTLLADKITTGTLDAAKVTVTNLNASNITSGTINASKIAVTNLNASNITSGTINASKIAVTNLNASNITSGTLSAARLSISGSGTNLLKNGAFLNGYKYWSDWGTCTRTVNTVNGKKWINLYTTSNTDEFRGMSQTTDAGSVVPGRTYTVSALAMPFSSTYVNKGLKIGVHILDSSGTILQQFWNDTTSASASVGSSTTNPVQVKFSFTITSSTATKVNVMIGGPSGEHFDYRVTDVMLSPGSIPGEWSAHKSEVTGTNTVIDNDGLTVYNGAITIKNTAGTSVLSADSSGNLSLKGSITSGSTVTGSSISGGTITGATITGGTLESSNGDMYFNMNSGYMHLYNSGTKVGQTFKNSFSGTTIYGLTNGCEYPSFSCLAAKTSSSASTFTAMVTVAGKDLTSYAKYGVNIGATLSSHGNNFNLHNSYLCFGLGASSYSTAGQIRWYSDASNWSWVGMTNTTYLGGFGKDGVRFGYRTSSTNTSVLGVSATDDSFSCKAHAWGNLNMHYWSIRCCDGVSTASLELEEEIPFAYSSSSNSEEAQPLKNTYSVVKTRQNIIESMGSVTIEDNVETYIELDAYIAYKDYMVILSPIGEDRKVFITRKEDDGFYIKGNAGIVDYSIKFNCIDISRYRTNIGEDAPEIITEEKENPKEVILSA